MYTHIRNKHQRALLMSIIAFITSTYVQAKEGSLDVDSIPAAQALKNNVSKYTSSVEDAFSTELKELFKNGQDDVDKLKAYYKLAKNSQFDPILAPCETEASTPLKQEGLTLTPPTSATGAGAWQKVNKGQPTPVNSVDLTLTPKFCPNSDANTVKPGTVTQVDGKAQINTLPSIMLNQDTASAVSQTLELKELDSIDIKTKEDCEGDPTKKNKFIKTAKWTDNDNKNGGVCLVEKVSICALQYNMSHNLEGAYAETTSRGIKPKVAASWANIPKLSSLEIKKINGSFQVSEGLQPQGTCTSGGAGVAALAAGAAVMALGALAINNFSPEIPEAYTPPS